MARYKNDPANTDYNAGDDFNYAVWTANTELTLCNVPWDAAYKDVVGFDSTNELNEYIDSNGDTTTISNSMYARIDEPINIDMPHGRAQRYNYIRVFNPAQPVSGNNDIPKYYYYFIRGIRHVTPETTEIVVQLDVWQTYIRLVQFGRAYIERGHIGIANSENFRNFGRDFLTIAEGLNTGADYMNVATVKDKVLSVNPGAIESAGGISVLAISTIDLHGELGDQNAPQNPSPKPSGIQGVPSGAGAYIWATAREFMAFMADYSDKPWATAALTSITIIPNIQRYLPNGLITSTNMGVKHVRTKSYDAAKFRPSLKRKGLFTDWRNSPTILNYIPARFRHLKKFLTSPYCQIEMTLNSGSAIVLKPESWNADDAPVTELVSILPPNQRAAFVPAGYNDRRKADRYSSDIGHANSNLRELQGDGLDMALFLTSFPTIPLVNNGQINYLASSARSIAAQYSAGDWAHEKAMRGNAVGYGNAMAGVGAGVDMANNAIGSDIAQTGIQQELAAQQALLNLVGGTASGAGMGAFAGPMGAVAGAAGGGVSGAMGLIANNLSADAANRSLGVRTGSAAANRDTSSGLGTYLADSNRGLADWAAKGDYSTQRAQMDAKIQDTAMIPHGVSGQFGGEAFNLVNDLVDLTLKFKMIDQAAMSVIGEYWLRYGYPVHRSSMIPNDLRVMDKFSYWKLSETYIRTAGMPEGFKQTIRGIMEKGVTVWNSPNDIGRIDFADNRPLPGITLEGYVPPTWSPEEPPVQPEPIKRRKTKMLVYATNDAGMKYALAGSSPGTPANWIFTESETLKDSFLDATGASEPVLVEVSKFYELEVSYLAPVSTFEYVEGA